MLTAIIPVAGSVESIRRITPQTLYDCHRAFYTPSNMILVCVGSMDPDQVAAEAEAILPKTCPYTGKNRRSWRRW